MRVGIQGNRFAVCPECDVYALMLEFAWAVPIYSPRDLAVITVHDYGQVVDRDLLEFGNLRLSIRAVHGALQMRKLGRLWQSELTDDDVTTPLERNLLGPTGIPDNGFAEGEWLAQLRRLSAKLMERPALVDGAIRTVINQVPAAHNQKPRARVQA